MAKLKIDKERLVDLLNGSHPLPTADRLYRDRSLFCVGGNLPLYETVETMFASYCMESTALFHLTFGTGETFLQGREMARQIKKNFNVRLMARLDHPVDEPILEQIYAAGVDNLILNLPEIQAGGHDDLLLQASRRVFPRWGVAAVLRLGADAPARTGRRIELLLQQGVVPLLQFTAHAAGMTSEEIESLLVHLAAGWEKNSVPLATYLPLISVMTPLEAAKSTGLFQGFVDRLRDRQQLAGSDIRRHLRVQPAENSLDSAGL